MQRYLRFALLAVLVATVGSAQAFGQATASGTVQGTVMDKSQAVMAGAEVVITSKATGATRTATTDDSGSFRFDLMSAGLYSVKVTKAGFSTFVQNVELLVGGTATVNATMEPGAVTQTIEVSGEAPIVDVAKTSVSQEITPKQVEELPMTGRDVANLAYLVPGVKAADSYDPTKNRYAILSVNGAGGRNVNVTVNGVDNKDNTVGGPVMQLPMEAVQEFQISTQRFSAENGRSEGAAINMITKSGTNDFHGSVFGFFRDTAFDADEKDPDGHGGYTTANPDYSRQQFGGSVGGPFVKNKLFGFFAIERERESQGLAETGQSFEELTLAANAGLAAQPAAVIPRPFYETRYNGRIDYTINSRNTAYLSYSSQANNSTNDQSDGTGDLTNGNFTRNHMQVANLTVNSILGNNAVNQFTVGYQFWNNLIDSDISAPLVIFPDASFGTNTNVPQESFQRKWQFKDDFSKTIGRHTLKGGVDYIWNPVEGGFFEFSSTLEIDFAKNPSTILGDTATYPDGFATPGLVTGMGIANGDPHFLVATKQLGMYFQDDWKMTNRLTLNLGLRWDKDFNMIGGSDIADSRTYQALVAFDNPISNPYVRKIASDDNKDFSPRVGFAYDVTGSGRHVVRGGFGLYYGNVFQNIPLFMEQMANETVFQQVLSLTSPTDVVPGTGIQLGNWRYGVDPLPTIPPPSTDLAPGSVGRLMDPDYRNPTTEEWNIGYSWALTPNSVFEAEYTHVLGLHENKTINIDKRVPVGGVCCTAPLNGLLAPGTTSAQFASVRNEESIGRSHYDGINFSYRQRMWRHLSLDANYTLAWAYSYGGGGGSFRNYPKDPAQPFASWEWGPNPNDERHHVTISGTWALPLGFQLSPILQYGSARPYDVTNSYNTINTGGGTGVGVLVPTDDPTNYLYGTNYINAFVPAYVPPCVAANPGPTATADCTAAGTSQAKQNLQMCFYAQQCPTQVGVPLSPVTMGKYDPLRGDPFFELDLRMAKNIRFGDRFNVQLIAQAFNLTNRANYGNDFGNSIASPDTFGHPVGFINPTSTVIPRALWGEFGVRFTF